MGVARRHRFAQFKPPAPWPGKPCRVGRVRRLARLVVAVGLREQDATQRFDQSERLARLLCIRLVLLISFESLFCLPYFSSDSDNHTTTLKAHPEAAQ